MFLLLPTLSEVVQPAPRLESPPRASTLDQNSASQTQTEKRAEHRKKNRLTNLQSRYKLTKSNDQEIKIEKEFELLIKYQREESDDRVFLISHYVRWV